MRAFGDEFIQIKRAAIHGILPRVRAREREHILDDAGEASRFMLKCGKRFSIFLGSARRIGKSDYGFTLQNCQRCAKFVGSVVHEAALAFECEIEAIEET